MTASIRYDDVLPIFASFVEAAVGPENVLDHCFLRDATGRVTFVVLKPIPDQALTKLRLDAARLIPWVDEESVVATPDDLFDSSLADPSASLPERIDHDAFHGFVRLVERRIVGQDWLQPPRDQIVDAPPIVVFASHKGGVGRSTALAVSASAFSAQGLNVLVIDLDLEAPGLGEMLLINPPRFGTLDFYVEDGVSDLSDTFFDDLIASSELAAQGLVHVAPAVGSISMANPQNVLGKIARAYLERTRSDGTVESFLDRTRRLVERLSNRNRYDAIFIDARAGLNEATAAAVLGLGAEVLLFGIDTPQTFAGYVYFLSHLERFRPTASGDADWRYRLRMVQAKAPADPSSQADFRTRAFEVFSDTLYDEEEGIEEEAFNFDYDDVTAPHFAWPILDDSNYAQFNPIGRRDQFSDHLYDRTFGTFIRALKEKIGLLP
jgi:Mrp family chromosome partitioning ATPase